MEEDTEASISTDTGTNKQQSNGKIEPRFADRCKLMTLTLYRGWFMQELEMLLRLCVPITLSLLFQYSLMWVSLFFLGHLPDEEGSNSYQYSAAGLGTAFLNVTGIAIGHGIATAADTLSSQAFGYKNYKRVGVILQRGILIMGLVMFPIWSIWLNTESLLLIFQQSPCVAKFSAIYVNVFILALPFAFLYILLQHYLQSQSIVWQFVLIGFISNVISVALHAFIIHGIGLGFIGAVVSLVISNVLPPLMVIGYAWCRDLHKETWGGWSFESLEEWWPFLKLAVPGMLMVGLEWWCAEIVNFLAGALGEVELAVIVIFFQLVLILYMPCLGLSIAVSVRVGNELGAGNPQGAKRASFIAVMITLTQCLLMDIFLISTKNVLPLLFISGNEEIAQRVSNLMYVACLFVCSDQIQSVIGGILRGSGRQYLGASVNFMAYYVIGLPLGALIGFKTNLGVLGILLGLLVGDLAQCIVFGVILIRTDWQKLSDEVVKSLNSKTEMYEEDDTKKLLSEYVKLKDATKEPMDSDREAFHVSKATPNKVPPYKMRKLLLYGSLLVVGVGVLIAGGVASNYHPHVDPDEYYNCTLYL